ncbi:Protein translocase subunit SecA [Rickettsiales bacterium Ac37b]|nr:Protein translocase subunit SecA [Rickettsiales bacterium Ac37b]
MFSAIARRLFGSVNDRVIKSLKPLVEEINTFEESLKNLSDQELSNKTIEFKEQLKNGAKLDSLIAPAFAVVREASRRILGLRHFDVQLMGGIVLHKGMIAEMRTGEGKTLVATLSTYLNALTGYGVHVITVNDYLAKRDSEWMGKLYNFLGLTVGCLVHGISDDDRKAAYNADITYGTNNEFGFDYLRDNMKYSPDHFVQRPFNYAIIDEVDSILIDEARTPLIISGPTEDNSDLYNKINKVVLKLSNTDYSKDEKSKTITLNDDGITKVETILQEMKLLNSESNLYDMENLSLVHHINQALRAHELFKRDVDYMVKDNKIMIIDEFTGRVMEGRRYSDGLHQALEAKENVTVQNENQTLASITFQNYFRLYPKLSGMTGTAMTEAAEFQDIYKLDVVEIPTHMQVKRKDEEDEIYRTVKEKYNAIVNEIEKSHKNEQPILVGTVSIEKSEYLSSLLKKKHIPHQVLNAKYHEQEALIIAQAGRPKAVTIATNMAGRGTDIMLGGNPNMVEAEKFSEADYERDKLAVLEAGGLLVLGTERHESRRIDNQLRGRSGRQGDPGRTKFFLSLEDDLMRIFGSDKISGLLQKLGMKEGESIFHPMISRALEKAQYKVEVFNYETRKNLLKFDDVMNDQRKIIYEQRIEIMGKDDVKDTLSEMYTELCHQLVSEHIPPRSYADEWDVEGLSKEVYHLFSLNLPLADWITNENIDEHGILNRILEEVENFFNNKEQKYGLDLMKMARKRFLLITLDQLWKEHLYSLDQLRQGINLRAYGQRDPLQEYKKEAFMMFDSMLVHLGRLFIERIAHLIIHENKDEYAILSPSYEPKHKMQESRLDPALSHNNVEKISQVRARTPKGEWNEHNPNSWGRVGRNEICPCGSNKKFKYCHGKLPELSRME